MSGCEQTGRRQRCCLRVLQQVSVGQHRAGQRCDVHVSPELLQFWIGAELLKTVARTSRGEVRKKKASKA